MPEKPKAQAYKWGKPPKRKEREPASMGKQAKKADRRKKDDSLKWLVLLVLSLVTSVLLFPNVLTQPKVYRLGDVAGADIKASRDFLIENKELTEKNRMDAVKGVFSVYDYDKSSSNLLARIKEVFKAGREYVNSLPQTAADGTEGEAQPPKPVSQEQSERLNQLKNRFFGTLELPPDDQVFDELLGLGFSTQIEETLIRLLKEVLDHGIVASRPMLNKQMEKGGIILHEISSKKETRITDLNRFYDLEEAKGALWTWVLAEDLDSPEQAAFILKLAQMLIKPNLTFNQRETELRKDQAGAAIKPIYFKIKRGEMLVREGERIGPEHLIKLSAQNKSQKDVALIGRVPAMAILVGFLLAVVYLIVLGETPSIKRYNRDFLFNALTLLALFIFAWAYKFVAEEIARGFPFFTPRALIFAMPVGFGAMLISIFQGLTISTAFSLVLAVFTSLITGGHVEYFIYFFIHNLVSAYGVRHCSERGVLIKTAFLLGAINLVLSLSMEMIYGSLYSAESVVAGASAFVGGILAGVMATGILPLIEMSFGFTTDIKLLELANLDQPLLRDLMVRAPGTYHHSVITSSMVEATAKAVQANPLLAKVSAYYHDIGKMKKPLYFIENQRGGDNKHEKLAPSMSALILISHVKDGVELARRHKLGREIIDIIQQHHGTSLISFFYQKAKDRMIARGGKSTEVKEEDFRYPGPKPQTKEAGLVMLADMVEAASRSLVDPTPARIQGTVQKIINKVFSDGQMDECELTLKDLHEIAKSFNQILSGIFHQRVEYPEAAGKNSKKGRNGHSDHVPAEPSGTKKSDDQAELDEGLRRLGL